MPEEGVSATITLSNTTLLDVLAHTKACVMPCSNPAVRGRNEVSDTPNCVPHCGPWQILHYLTHPTACLIVVRDRYCMICTPNFAPHAVFNSCGKQKKPIIDSHASPRHALVPPYVRETI